MSDNKPIELLKKSTDYWLGRIHEHGTRNVDLANEIVEHHKTLEKQVKELKEELKHCYDTRELTAKLRKQLIKDGLLPDEKPFN